MEILRKEFTVPSVSGVADVFARMWYPDDGVKAIFQITHGMAEHGERYEDLASFLCKKGIATVVHDHVGHGKSVRSDDDLGYFGPSNGWNSLVEDTRAVTLYIEKEYPDVPIIYFGHSMGSFIGREYIRRYGTDERIKCAIICGTSGKNPAASIAIVLADIIAKLKGEKYRSEFINKLAFGTYNKKITLPSTAFDWLTTDEAQVYKYGADKRCGFVFTATGFRDLFTLLSRVSSNAWFNGVPKTLPILVTAGENDPVGSYGKGVKQVFNGLRDAGCKDVTLKLYPGMRHEIHNEKDNRTVYEDLATWSISKI